MPTIDISSRNRVSGVHSKIYIHRKGLALAAWQRPIFKLIPLEWKEQELARLPREIRNVGRWDYFYLGTYVVVAFVTLSKTNALNIRPPAGA